MASREREAQEKHRRAVRARFRRTIRSVMTNRLWLTDTGEQKMSLNVKKNIAMFLRQQRRVGLLSLAEKGLLRMEHANRTVEERRLLVSLLAGLTCFSKIPPKVRARLVACIQFIYLGKDQKLIREGDPPNTVYFLLTGEIEATRSVYDHVKKKRIDKVEYICGPGDIIGDIEMIEEIRRFNTLITTTECELLMLVRDDFDRVLRPVMSRQWFDKKTALQSLGYFDFLNESQIIAACKMGFLRQFEPLETIYFEDKGSVTYVHFVISGECMILQCLQIEVTMKDGVRHQKLVEIEKSSSNIDIQGMTNKELIMKLKEVGDSDSKPKFNVDDMVASAEDLMDDESKRKLAARKMDLKSIEAACAKTRQLQQEAQSERSRHSSLFEEPSDSLELHGEDDEGVYRQEGDSFDDLYDNDADKAYKFNVDSGPSIKGKQASRRNSRRGEEEVGQDATSAAAGVEEADGAWTANLDENSFASTFSSTFSSSSGEARPEGPKIENHFIDVGSITFGGIFGLGERLDHRVIMARTTVQCLMLPRFFLLDKERNPGNIWQRRRFYLDSTIPSRKSLFEDFLTTRKWQEFKRDFIQSCLDPESNSNPTKVQDIPIICRIVEAND